nr:DNA glycosylase [uncultured Ruminococcus sp.]
MKKFLKFENVTDLDLAQTLDCGQSFRWVEREDYRKRGRERPRAVAQLL